MNHANPDALPGISHLLIRLDGMDGGMACGRGHARTLWSRQSIASSGKHTACLFVWFFCGD